jgi:3-oxoacyl-[acyl-carrier-protein] synthase-3
MARSAAVTGWGHYVPETVLTNDELAKRVDTTDEWIRTRTGIRERRIAGPGETTSSMCATAALRALGRAELDPADIELIVCATTTPDYLLPATAGLVQAHIGATRSGAFDVNSACNGFLTALTVGAQFVQTGAFSRVLVVAGETLSRFLDWTDRKTCVLLGDGAGAAVLEATEEPCGLQGPVLGCQGDTEHLLAVEAGGCARPATAETVARGDHYMRMRGQEVFRLAVRSLTRACEQAMAKAGLTAPELRMVVPHQANLRILAAVREALDVPVEKLYLNLHRLGNTGAASVAIALSEVLEIEAIRPGDPLLLAAFGGGLTWGAAVLRHADVPAIIAARKLHGRGAARPRLQTVRG